MKGYPYCGTTNCSACTQIQQQDYLKTPSARSKRLQRIINARVAQMNFSRPIIDEVFDEDYQTWIDNELSWKGEPA